jgi:hypothetical protein
VPDVGDSCREAGPGPFAASRVGGEAPGGGEGADDGQAPAAVVVPVLFGEVEGFEGQLDHWLGLGDVVAGVPDGDQYIGRLTGELEFDLLSGGCMSSIGDELCCDQKNCVRNMKTIIARGRRTSFPATTTPAITERHHDQPPTVTRPLQDPVSCEEPLTSAQGERVIRPLKSSVSLAGHA